MKITNEFTVHTPIDEAWKLLTDLEAIAPCMPGAVLTGIEGDTYKGKVKIKVGPVISEFAGTARFLEKSDTDYRASIDAKGRDARAAGNASAVVTALLRPSGDNSTTVSVDTDLKITGKLAQFGSGMIKEVSSKLLAQFVANLEAKLATDSAPSAVSAEAPAVPPVSESASAASDPAAVGPDATAPSAAAVETVPETAVALAPVEPTPVNGSTPATATQAPAVTPPRSATPVVETPARGGSPVVETPTRDATPVAETRAAGAPSATTINGASHASAVKAPSAPAARTSIAPQPEPEPIDLLSVAGSSVYKRLIPLGAVVVVIVAIIAWLVGRR